MRTACVIVGLGLATASGIAWGAGPVSDRSFDKEANVVTEEVRIQRDSGAFGRAGEDIPVAEGVSPNRVNDRDINRYERRLAVEIRTRNAVADAEGRETR